VEDCIDHDLDLPDLEKYRVRKAPKESTSHPAVHELVRFGMALDRREAHVDRSQEPAFTPSPLVVVPGMGFVKI